MKMNSSKQFYVDSNHDDDEQVKSTLKFFDSILEEYLDDEENQNHRLSSSVIDLSRLNLNYSRPVGRENNSSKTSFYQKSLALSSTDLRYKAEPHPKDLPRENKRSAFVEPVKNETNNQDSTQLPFSSKLQLNDLNENVILNSQQGFSASLIDLTTINQVNNARPLYRFVPPDNKKIPMKQNSKNIVKPTVIVPSINPSAPKSVPSIRITENQFHHEHEASAFKPLSSSRNNLSTNEHSTNNNVKRKEVLSQQINSNRVYHHQSMYDLTADETPSAYLSMPSTNSNFSNKSSHYVRQTNPNSRPTRYQPSTRSPSNLLTKPVNRWLEQMKDSSTMNPLPPAKPSYVANRPYGYSSNSYLVTSAPSTNGYDSSNRSSYYQNQNSTRKVPYAAAMINPSNSVVSSTGDVYYFDANSNRNSSKKTRSTNYGPPEKGTIISSYL